MSGTVVDTGDTMEGVTDKISALQGLNNHSDSQTPNKQTSTNEVIAAGATEKNKWGWIELA